LEKKDCGRNSRRSNKKMCNCDAKILSIQINTLVIHGTILRSSNKPYSNWKEKKIPPLPLVVQNLKAFCLFNLREWDVFNGSYRKNI